MGPHRGGSRRSIYAAMRSGKWRSTDSGAAWEQMLAANVRGGCIDLAMRPDQPQDALFAPCGLTPNGVTCSPRRIARPSPSVVKPPN